MDMNTIKELWEALNNSSIKEFHYWPNADVPRGKPGVYLIYQIQELIYVGMAKKTCMAAYTNMQVDDEAVTSSASMFAID